MNVDGFVIIGIKHETKAEKYKYSRHYHISFIYTKNGNYFITYKLLKAKWNYAYSEITYAVLHQFCTARHKYF